MPQELAARVGVTIGRFSGGVSLLVGWLENRQYPLPHLILNALYKNNWRVPCTAFTCVGRFQ